MSLPLILIIHQFSVSCYTKFEPDVVSSGLIMIMIFEVYIEIEKQFHNRFSLLIIIKKRFQRVWNH